MSKEERLGAEFKTKVLIDAGCSKKVMDVLHNELNFEVFHVGDVLKNGAKDIEVYEYALKNDIDIIVAKDSVKKSAEDLSVIATQLFQHPDWIRDVYKIENAKPARMIYLPTQFNGQKNADFISQEATQNKIKRFVKNTEKFSLDLRPYIL